MSLTPMTRYDPMLTLRVGDDANDVIHFEDFDPRDTLVWNLKSRRWQDGVCKQHFANQNSWRQAA
ncbi:MAG: hypothetical protein Q8L44_14815 [Sulfuritalea sp.]|nr:hypothetical protein [Sulfuritalea sp.]